MIEKKLVDRFAHQSGVRDQLVAEREVVLTYALHALHEAKTLDLLAFKGGTCLRKIVFGSTVRFSEDLDFTLRGDDNQDALTALYEVFNGEHHGVGFSLDDWYETDDGFGMEVQYRHAWNSAGKFRLQVSTREKPTLAVGRRPMAEQVYFRDLEFELFDVPCLETIEMAAEKVRAAFQRAKVRDLYDLHLFPKTRLAVRRVAGLVERGESLAAILRDYPFLTENDVRFAVMYTRASSPDYAERRAMLDELTAEAEKLKLGY